MILLLSRPMQFILFITNGKAKNQVNGESERARERGELAKVEKREKGKEKAVKQRVPSAE